MSILSNNMYCSIIMCARNKNISNINCLCAIIKEKNYILNKSRIAYRNSAFLFDWGCFL